MAHDLKTYPAPWDGDLILACRKCQKKLKGNEARRDLAKLKKSVKRYNKQHPYQPLHVLDVPCMNLCPKDGVTVCSPARDSNRLSILRSLKDLSLLRKMQVSSTPPDVRNPENADRLESNRRTARS